MMRRKVIRKVVLRLVQSGRTFRRILHARYMGYDSVIVQKMYLAGALHDIGKMAVGNEILEKLRMN